jgi:prepilin-type processing-associated H-X9-DG protein
MLFGTTAHRASPRAREAICRCNLRQIGLAIGQYYEDHTNAMPRTLADLKPYTGGSERIFICPDAKDNTGPSYRLLSDVEWQSEKLEPIVVEVPGNRHRDGGNVLYNDGHVDWVNAIH